MRHRCDGCYIEIIINLYLDLIFICMYIYIELCEDILNDKNRDMRS